MSYFKKIADGINVRPLQIQLDAHPELWDQRKARTTFENSPFAGTSDLWLRYRNPSELKTVRDYIGPHWAVNYPAWYALPAVEPIVFDLMHEVRAIYLGGVMMTKIPPGGRIREHDDKGSWHAEEMECKVYVPIRANDSCVNYCGGERMVIREGEAVSFNNLVTHSVENNGDTDRVTLIICMRRM